MWVFAVILACLLVIGAVALLQWIRGREGPAPDAELAAALRCFKKKNEGAFTSPSEELAALLCQRLQGQIQMDEAFLRGYGCSFRYRLMGEYEHLQVNFEIFRRKQEAARLPEEIKLGLRVYDADRNLLHAEEIWVYRAPSGQGYDDFFYLEVQRIRDAASMEICVIEDK